MPSSGRRRKTGSRPWRRPSEVTRSPGSSEGGPGRRGRGRGHGCQPLAAAAQVAAGAAVAVAPATTLHTAVLQEHDQQRLKGDATDPVRVRRTSAGRRRRRTCATTATRHSAQNTPRPLPRVISLVIAATVVVANLACAFSPSRIRTETQHAGPLAHVPNHSSTVDSKRPVELNGEMTKSPPFRQDADRADSKNKSTQNKINIIRLVSLPPLFEESPRIVRDVWKWKDVVLGDGRDYFVPRPRALKAFSDLLVARTSAGCTVTECAVLSNCARMDVLLSLEVDSMLTHDDVEENQALNIDDMVKSVVANCINEQVVAFQSERKAPLMESISSFLDLPGMVIEKDAAFAKRESNFIAGQQENANDQSRKLATLLTATSAVDEIVRHFSKVAAGMAPRVSRVDRPVLFRPFSSRDAHVMLQLKRTAEVAGHYVRMKIILDAALNAGKAARDTNHCPVLKKLKGYDEEGRYSPSAPPRLAQEVAEEVVQLAIEPAVQRGIERLKALEFSDRIVMLRQRVRQLYDENDEEGDRLARQLLHGPCMDLRNGEDVDVDQVFEGIHAQLKIR